MVAVGPGHLRNGSKVRSEEEEIEGESFETLAFTLSKMNHLKEALRYKGEMQKGEGREEGCLRSRLGERVLKAWGLLFSYRCTAPSRCFFLVE